MRVSYLIISLLGFPGFGISAPIEIGDPSAVIFNDTDIADQNGISPSLRSSSVTARSSAALRSYFEGEAKQPAKPRADNAITTSPMKTGNDDIVAGYPGDIRVENHQNGYLSSVYLRAMDTCKILPEGFAHEVENIRQAAGAVCKYFSSSACDDHHLMIKKRSPGDTNLSGSDIKQVAAVACVIEPIWTVEARRAPPFDADRGYVFACNKAGCMGVPALQACRRFTKTFHHNLERIWQKKGVVCKYLRNDCSEVHPVIVLDSRHGDIDTHVGTAGRRIGRVLCREANWSTAEAGDAPVITPESDNVAAISDAGDDEPQEDSVELRDAGSSSTSLQKRHSAMVLENLADSSLHVRDPDIEKNEPNYLVVWSETKHKGESTRGTYESCTTSSFTVRSIFLAKGYRCTFFFEEDCKGLYFGYGSQTSTLSRKNLKYPCRSFRCSAYPKRRDDAIAGTESSTPHHSVVSPENNHTRGITSWVPNPPTTDPASGPLTVCHEENLTGKCFTLTENAPCSGNPFNVDRIKSLSVAAGWRCAMYLEAECQAVHSPPHYEEGKGANKVVGNVGYDIVSMHCGTSPYER